MDSVASIKVLANGSFQIVFNNGAKGKSFNDLKQAEAELKKLNEKHKG